MTGVTTDEGKQTVMELVYQFDSTKRGAGNLLCGLFINTGAGGAAGDVLTSASTLSDIVPQTGTGYSQATLTNATWVVATDGDTSYTSATTTFTASGADWDDVYGYYIETAGGILLHYEYNASAPVAVANGESYVVDLTNILD